MKRRCEERGDVALAPQPFSVLLLFEDLKHGVSRALVTS
jgi:hypothetical protein